MKNYFFGLDVLRGLGIFTVLILHSAFYYFDGIYEVDFNNPPAIVTAIGLLLMFAGMFATISGFVHTLSTIRKTKQQISRRQRLKFSIVYGVVMLAIAYAYFIFTGPGIIDFSSKSMNNSVLVELIRNGNLIPTNFERVFYIDSLVMIGTNIMLLAVFSFFVIKAVPAEKLHRAYFISGIMFMIISLIRIPLYTIWQNALDVSNYALYMFLNPFVAKNNPIFPFFAFALLGGWLATLTVITDFKKICARVIPFSAILLVSGIMLYVNLEDTMLERAIDLKWYAIMIAQLGLFLLFFIAALRQFDYSKNKKRDLISVFFARFSKGGLTAFFLESVVSVTIYRIISSIIPGFSVGIAGALLYGICLALLWGIVLFLWEKAHYKFSLEYFIAQLMNKVGRSQKSDKLQGLLGENDVRDD